MKKKEIEIKIELTSEEFSNFTKDIADFNFEKTFGYFKKDFSNIQEGIFPRIKCIKGKKKEIILGVKVKVGNNNQFFEREETEVKIDENEDVNNLRDVLKSLGFSQEIIFEKKRRNIIKDNITISFDELPFGFFVEFEGKPEKIEKYVRELKLSDKPRIIKSYLGLWEECKNRRGIKEKNCVFK